MDERTSSQPNSIIWLVAFVVTFIGMGAALLVLRPPLLVQLPLMLLPFLFMIPYVKSYERKAQAQGFLSPALQRYNRRFAVASIAYVVLLFIAIYSNKEMGPLGAVAWPIALLPAIAVIGMIWTMARYLIEEDDEYLRQRQAMAALIATGILLTVATTWGFLENFMLVPHIPAWSAFPIWALGLGIGQIILKVRGA